MVNVIQKYSYVSEFRKCTVQDFKQRNIDFVFTTENLRFCPDLEKIKDEWILSNIRNNGDDRYYKIEIVKCKPINGVKCEDESKIIKLLRYLYF